MCWKLYFSAKLRTMRLAYCGPLADHTTWGMPCSLKFLWVVWLHSHLCCFVVDSEWMGTWSSSRIPTNILYRWSETNQFQPYARVVVAPVMESMAFLFGLLGVLDIFHMCASIPWYHGKGLANRLLHKHRVWSFPILGGWHVTGLRWMVGLT